MNDFEFEGNFDKVGYKKMLLNARRIYRGDTGSERILLAIEDSRFKYWIKLDIIQLWVGIMFY